MLRIANVRILSVLLIGAVLLLTDSAQALTGNRAGFFVGLNFANQGGDMERVGQELADELEFELGGSWTSSKGSNMGLGLGGFYTIQTSPTFGVQIEGQYIQRGTKLELKGTIDSYGYELGSVTLDTEFQINYLEIPVLARFSPSPAAKFRPLFLVGPVIGFKTGANLKMSAQGESESESISEGYKSVNFGLLGGVGFSALVGKTSYITVQARYFMGLTNPITDDEFNAKSGDFGIFAGMEFAIGK